MTPSTKPNWLRLHFPVRYRGRTLEAYRYHLRAFVKWAADDCLKPAVIPLVPRTARPSTWPSASEPCPILLRHDGRRLDRRTAHRGVRSVAKRAGIGGVHPPTLRAAFVMCALEAGVPLREVQIAASRADPRTTTGL